ncbi:MAG: hypothetical protein WC325_13550, partial [Candidatus Bathyarchaeia archaeon]
MSAQVPASSAYWQQIQQIQQENARFEAARAAGQISQAQYNTAMAYQNQRLSQLQQQPSVPTPQPAPAPVVDNTPPDISGTTARPPSAINQASDLNQAATSPSQIDQGPLETPQQVGVVFTTGPITQAEIDWYAGRGKFLVPDSLKLPQGAKVTGSRIEDGQIIVEYKTTEMQELEQQLNLDAVKWEQAGFS